MEASKRFGIRHNVTFRVLDQTTGKLIREQQGHNSATNTLLEGVGHYLAGEGVLRQGYSMLSNYIPRYISLGTMGLRDQNEDSDGLPTGISGKDYTGDESTDFSSYVRERPGYGSDGYNILYNNNRPYMGLGPAFSSFSPESSYRIGDIVYYNGVAYEATADMIVNPELGLYNYWNSENWQIASSYYQPSCYELITPSSPRIEISFREVVPEYEAENPKSIDVVFSAMISSNALDEFRTSTRDYIFITEAGLWSRKDYQPEDIGTNGLVAGYRILPPHRYNRWMNSDSVPTKYAIEYLSEEGITDPTDEQILEAKSEIAANNRDILKQEILRVERNQVVQVIWKIQIGNFDEEGYYMSGCSSDIEELKREVDILNGQVSELYNLFGTQILFDDYIVVPTYRWDPSNTYPGYNYQASINFPGVDETYVSIVEFDNDDNHLFRFAPNSVAIPNTIYIYCETQPTKSIIIPSILCLKGTRVHAT